MKIPLYFNYIENTFPELLKAAVESVDHEKIEVHVVRHTVPKPFTHCLNDIQKECLERGDKYWMFMHCDATILDNSIFDLLIKRYENPEPEEKIASVCACSITDLLVLFDTQAIDKLNGWNSEKFDNSFMELDLRHRILRGGFAQPIVYMKCPCPPEMSHKESSSLRDKGKEGNLFKVYSVTYEKDLRNFYAIYRPNMNVDKNVGFINWKKYVDDPDNVMDTETF